jgi:LmbE family N-acetylglucosaminyl deacetylase
MSGSLNLRAKGAEIYVPDGVPLTQALKRTTHLGVGAHQDDLEFMAYHGILECFGHKKKRWFTGVTLNNGSGSARGPHYKGYTGRQMMEARKQEQKKAAFIGEYAAQFLLNHSTQAVEDPQNADVAADLDMVLAHCRPQVVYTHNFQDKHDSHVAVSLRLIGALRRLPKNKRPKKVIGCEVWRSLDWLCDKDKVVMPVDGHENLADALMGVFDSQIFGGKRYDLATRGRRLANATYFETHALDKSKALAWGMDMTPLLENDALDPFDYTKSYMDRFAEEVKDRIRRMGQG